MKLRGYAGNDRNVAKYYAFRALMKRFILPVIGIYMLEQGLSLPSIGLIATVAAATGLILEIPSGMAADKLGHKRALVVASLGQALSMGLFFGGSFWWILAGSVGYMVAGSLMTGTSEALFFEYHKRKGLQDVHQKHYGRAKSFSHAVGILSMGLAGLAYTVHPLLPFVVGVLQFIVGAWVIGTFEHEASEQESVEKREGFMGWLRHFPEAWRQISSSRQLLWVTMAASTLPAFRYANAEFEQLLLTEAGVIASIIGFIYMAQRITGTVVFAVAHKVTTRLSTAQMTVVTALLVGVSFMLPVVLENPLLYTIPILIGVVGAFLLDVSVNERMNQLIEKGSRATVLSMKNFIRGLIQLGIPAAYGVMLLSMDLVMAMAILGVVAIVIGIVVAWRMGLADRFTV